LCGIQEKPTAQTAHLRIWRFSGKINIHKKFQGQQVAELSEAKSEAEANRLIKQLNSSYESYHAFFE